jgi:hypothetical protein
MGGLSRTATKPQRIRSSRKSSFFSILPYLEVQLSTSGTVLPFLFATLGTRSGSASSGDQELSSFSQFIVGGGLGAHIFGAEGFSVDPAGTFFYVSSTENVADSELTGSGTALLLTLGLSGWMGGSSRSAAAQPEAHDRPEAAAPDVAQRPTERPPDAQEQGVYSGGVQLPGSVRLLVVGHPRTDGYERSSSPDVRRFPRSLRKVSPRRDQDRTAVHGAHAGALHECALGER